MKNRSAAEPQPGGRHDHTVRQDKGDTAYVPDVSNNRLLGRCQAGNYPMATAAKACMIEAD